MWGARNWPDGEGIATTNGDETARIAGGQKRQLLRHQHMTMLDTPTFFAAMPRTFLDKILALKPDPATGKPDPAALAAFAKMHPESAGLPEHNPPPSYANSAYFGIHTFRFIDRDERTTLVRWRFVPQDGEKSLTDAELASRPRDFLERALIERTKRGPMRWDMVITIGQPGSMCVHEGSEPVLPEAEPRYGLRRPDQTSQGCGGGISASLRRLTRSGCRQ